MPTKHTKVTGITMPQTMPTPEEFQNHYDTIFESDPGINGDTFADGIEKFHGSDDSFYLPTKEEILAAGKLAKWEREGYDISGGADVLWETIKRAPKAIAASAITAFQGAGGADVVDPDVLEQWARGVREENQVFAQDVEQEFQGRKVLPGIEVADVGELGQNIGFSGAAALAGLGVAAPVSLIPVVGKPLAYLAGASAAGTVAYNAAAYDFMDEILQFFDGRKMEDEGQHLTAEEQETIKQQSMDLAHKHGLWEAIPEAVGSAVGFNLLMKPLNKMFGKHLATRLAQKLAGVYGEELVTETITQMGQKDVRYDAVKWGLVDPNTAEPVDYTDYKQWTTALKEVAPQVFLLTTALGGSTYVGSKAWNALTSNPETRKDLETNVVESVNTGQHKDEIVTDEVFADLYEKAKNLEKTGSQTPEFVKAVTELEVQARARKLSNLPIDPNLEQFALGDFFDEQNNEEIIQKVIDGHTQSPSQTLAQANQEILNFLGPVFGEEGYTAPTREEAARQANQGIIDAAPGGVIPAEDTRTQAQINQEAIDKAFIPVERTTEENRAQVAQDAINEAQSDLEIEKDLAPKFSFKNSKTHVEEELNKQVPGYDWLYNGTSPDFPGYWITAKNPDSPMGQSTILVDDLKPETIKAKLKTHLRQFEETEKRQPKYSFKSGPRKIIAAIHHIKSGDIFTGRNHGEAYEKATEKYPLFNNDFMDYVENYEDGFVTDKGDYLSREDAGEYITGKKLSRFEKFDERNYLISEEIPLQNQLSFLNKGRGEGVDLPEIRKAFPGTRVDISQALQGKFTVTLPNGVQLEVESVNVITPNDLSIVGRWREVAAEGALPTGEYQDSKIRIRKGIGDQWTLHHESLHFMRDMDLIKPKEWAALKGRVMREIRNGNLQVNDKSNPGSEEDIADWVADQMYKGGVKPTSLVGKALKVIKDFVNAIVDKIYPSAKGVVRQIQSGDIFQRPVDPRPVTGKREFQTAAPRWFSAMTKLINENKGLIPKKTSALKMQNIFYKLTRPTTKKKKGRDVTIPSVIKRQEYVWSGIGDYISDKVNSTMLDYMSSKDAEVLLKRGIILKEVDDAGEYVYSIKHIVPPGAEAYPDFDHGEEIELEDIELDLTSQGVVDPIKYWGFSQEKADSFTTFLKDAPSESNVQITRQEILDYLDSNKNMEVNEVLRGPVPEWYVQDKKDKEGAVTKIRPQSSYMNDPQTADYDRTFVRAAVDELVAQESAINSVIAEGRVDTNGIEELIERALETESYKEAEKILVDRQFMIQPDFNTDTDILSFQIVIMEPGVGDETDLETYSAAAYQRLITEQPEVIEAPQNNLAFNTFEEVAREGIREAVNDLIITRVETLNQVPPEEFFDAIEEIQGQISIEDQFIDIKNLLETEGYTLSQTNDDVMFMIQEPRIGDSGGGVWEVGHYQEMINQPDTPVYEQSIDELFNDPELEKTESQIDYLEGVGINTDPQIGPAPINTFATEFSGGYLNVHDAESSYIREAFARYDLDPQVVLDNWNDFTEVEQVNITEQVDSHENLINSIIELAGKDPENPPIRIISRASLANIPRPLVREPVELPTKRDKHGGTDLILQTEHLKNYRELEVIVARPTGVDVDYHSSHWSEKNVAFHIRFQDTKLPDGTEVLFIDEIQSDMAKDITERWPFIKNYVESALRRMVRWAAESGKYGAIGWTTGPQQVERYETATRRRVDSVEWEVEGTDIEGREIVHLQGFKDGKLVTPEQITVNLRGKDKFQEEGDPGSLDDYIGEDSATKIRNEYNLGTSRGAIKAEDLTIGGQGMSRFYDEIIPSTFNKLFGKKSFGSPKAGISKIGMNNKNEHGYLAKDAKATVMDRTFTLGGHEFFQVQWVHGTLSTLGMEHDSYLFQNKETADEFGLLLNTGITKIDKVQLLEDDIVMVDYVTRSGPDSKSIKFASELDSLTFAADLDALKEILSGSKENIHTFELTPEMTKKALREGFPVYSFKSAASRFEGEAGDSMKAAMQSLAGWLPKNIPHMSFIERMFKSPEWYSHPIFKRLVGHAIDRSELYHDNFSNLNEKDSSDVGSETVAQATENLKAKGLPKRKVIRGKTSKDYKDLDRMIDDGDTKWREGQGAATPEQIQKFEQFYRDKGYSEDTLKVWRMHRQAYDKALDLLLIPMKEMLVEQGNVKNIVQIQDIKTQKKKMMSLKEAISYMSSWRGYYAPRLRDSGNWVVQGNKGEDYVRKHFRTRFEANKEKIRMERIGFTVKDVHEDERIPEEVYQTLQQVSTEKILNRAAKKQGLDPEMERKFKEDIIREVADLIRVRGFRSHMIHRRSDSVVKGYIEDPLQRFLRYTSNISSGLAKAETASKMAHEMFKIDEVKDPAAYTEAQRYIKEQLRNADKTDRFIGKAKALASLKYLGLPNLRSPLINMTAMLTTVPPSIQQYVLGGKGNFRTIARAITRAGKDYGKFMAKNKQPKGMTGAEFEMMVKFKLKGYDTPQQTQDIMGEMEGDFGKNWGRMMSASMYLFSKSEQWNRGSTMLAAYRLGKEKGLSNEEAEKKAKLSSDKAHGLYGKATLPAWAQGQNPLAKVGQMFYVYLKFAHNWMQLMYDLGVKKHNMKALVYAMASPVVLGGGSSFLMKSAFLAVISALMSALGDDRDPEKLVYDSIRDHFGETGETAARYGLTGLIGNVDISGSMSVDPGVPTKAYDLLGAIGGVAKDLGDASRFLSTGQYLRAAETALPVGLGNYFRGLRETQGVTTRKGRTVFDKENRPFKPTVSETGKRFAGFRSARSAGVQQRQWEKTRQGKKFSDKRAKIYERYRSYLANKNLGQYRRVLKELQKYNKQVRTLGPRSGIPQITVDSLKRQAKGFQRPTKRQRL